MLIALPERFWWIFDIKDTSSKPRFCSNPTASAHSPHQRVLYWRHYALFASNTSIEFNALVLHNLLDNRTIATLPCNKPDTDMKHVSISPDGVYIRAVSAYATVKIWHLRTGKELLSFQDTYPARPPSLLSASFSPDGSHVALPHTHGPLRICRVRDGECVASFVHRGTWVTKLAFTPDGKTICYGMEDGTVYVRSLSHLIS